MGVSKTIGWMNRHDELKQPISFKDVAGVLTSIGDANAGRLLKELSDKKETINDPTAWLKAAAMRKGMGKTMGGGDMMSMMMAMMGGVGGGKGRAGGNKIGKSIGWINKNLAVENPIK